jgi:RNA polymerase sigma-70 factor (ECF subfamily)
MSAEWASLYSAHASDIASFLLKLTGDTEVASELMQETFVRAIRSGTDAQTLQSARGWLFRIAANLAHDHRRRRALLRFVPFSGREASTSALDDPGPDLVRRALQSLPATQATTLLLHYEAGFSRKEIAEQEGTTEEAIKSRLARGREAFARSYVRMGGDIA